MVMDHQENADDCISDVASSFRNYYTCEYPNSQAVKEGLKRVLRDRYQNNVNSFKDNFVHPTLSLLSRLQEENFPFCLPNGNIVLHLVPPQHKLIIGEFFYQIGHTNPRTLVIKFAKYQNKGESVKEQPSRVDERDYDITFTKEYFDKVRSEAETLGDVLMRTLIVLSGQDWSVVRESAKEHLGNCPEGRQGRLRSESHLSVQESCRGESTSSEDLEPRSPSENCDFSSSDDAFSQVLSSGFG